MTGIVIVQTEGTKAGPDQYSTQSQKQGNKIPPARLTEMLGPAAIRAQGDDPVGI
jgi:hypothetical protein